MNIYETHVIKNPQLPFIFHCYFQCFPHRGFGQANWHENIEIILVINGKGTIMSDTDRIAVERGDIVIINTNRLHNFAARDEALAYRCLIVDRSFCLSNHFDTNAIEFDKHFRDAEIERLLNRLTEEYTLPSDTPYRTQTIRATVLEIMAILCRAHSRPAPSDQNDKGILAAIKQAIGYIRSESHRDIALDDIAAFVGLSKYHFAREFHRVTGYTFVSYLNLTRCEKAKQLLAENSMSIGDIGHVCGFVNRSYFTRTFRAYVGMLPSVYRESHQSPQN